MKKYLGVKLILARPMCLFDYNQYRGLSKEEDETNAEGYLVEYVAGGVANHPDHKGYISWSPKDVFDLSHVKTDGFQD